MTLRSITLLVLLFCGINASAQTRINIKAADSLDFILTFNEQKVNNIPCISITLDEQPSGKVGVSLAFQYYESLNFTQIVTLKKNTSVFFEIGSTKTGFKLNLVSESAYYPMQKNVVNINATADEETIVGQKETLELSNNITIQDFDKLTSEVKETHFELKKLDKIKTYLDSRMLTIDQFRYLMALLDTEDSKLVLLANHKNQIVDSAHLSSLVDDFFLQKNKEKAQQILSN